MILHLCLTLLFDHYILSMLIILLTDRLINSLNQSFAEIQHDSKSAERESRQRLDQVVCYHFADE
jgi:hypothetical protein